MFTRLAIIFSCIITYTMFTRIYAATTTTASSFSTIASLRNYKCGIANPGGLMKNSTLLDINKQSGLGEFPWTVAIYKNDNILTCAGSLILPNIVLTAAHCVTNIKKEDLKIKAGLWDSVNKHDEKYPIQERIVSQIITHPEFLNENNKIKNDIALLVLDKPVELSQHIGLACLAKKDHVEKSNKCYVAGWGMEDSNAKKSNILKKSHLSIIAKDECEKKLKEKTPSIEIDDKVFCAGGDKTHICQGDGGAGLICITEPESENRYIESGIASWGLDCTHLPGIYTNLSKYRDWIDEHVQKLGGDSKLYTIA